METKSIIASVWAIVATVTASYYYYVNNQCPYVWHGGSPMFSKGSCWCGKDGYCLCTPSLAIEAVLEFEDAGDLKIVLIKRRDPPEGFAIPGGFVSIGESVETAAAREIREEMNLLIDAKNLQQFRVYSDPNRDNRRATASVIFRYPITSSTANNLKTGDDAKSLIVTNLKDVHKIHNLAFDHPRVLADYINHYHPQLNSQKFKKNSNPS